MGGVDSDAVKCLNWAASIDKTVDDLVISDAEDVNRPGHLAQLNGQVCTALSLLVQGDAMDKLRQVPDGHGLEAWRRVVAFYEPTNRGHKLNILNRLTNPRPQPGVSALRNIEAWEDSVTTYERRFQVAVEPDMRMGARIQLLPEA